MKDFSKLNQKEIAELSPEEFKEYVEYVAGLKTDKGTADQAVIDLKKEKQEAIDLLAEQANQIKDAEAVKHETQPTVTHKIDKQKVTVRVNVKKFQHLNEDTGMWVTYTLKDLEDHKLGPVLIKQLLAGKSNVVKQLNTKNK